MKSIRDNFRNSQSTRTSKPEKRNIAVVVGRYDTTGERPQQHFVEGVDIETQKTIRIHLRDIEGNELSENPRPGIVDYEKPSEEKAAMKVNSSENGESPGVLLFEDCQELADGVYAAGWMRSLIHDSKKTNEEVKIGLATLIIAPGKFNPNTPDAPILNNVFLREAITNNAQAFAMSESDRFIEFVKSSLTQPENEGKFRPEVILRIVEDSGTSPQVELASILTAPYKASEDGEIPELCNPNECLEAFMSTPKNDFGIDVTPKSWALFQDILDFMKNNPSIDINEAFIEVIPVQRRNFGSESKKSLVDLQEIKTDEGERVINAKTPRGQMMVNRYLKRNGDEDVTRVWAKTIFATSQAAETVERNGQAVKEYLDYRFITKSNTSQVFPKGYSLQNIPTANFSDESKLITVFGNNENSQHAALAAQQKSTAPAPTQQSVQTAQQQTQTEVQPSKTAATKPKPKTKAAAKNAALSTQSTQTKPNAVSTTDVDDTIMDDVKAMLNDSTSTSSIADTQTESAAETAQSFESVDDELVDELDDALFGDISNMFNQPTMPMR